MDASANPNAPVTKLAFPIIALLFILSACGTNNVDTVNHTTAQYSYRFVETFGSFSCDTGLVAAATHEGFCNNLKSDTLNTDVSTGKVCAFAKRQQKFKEECACWLRKLYPNTQYPKDLYFDQQC